VTGLTLSTLLRENDKEGKTVHGLQEWPVVAVHPPAVPPFQPTGSRRTPKPTRASVTVLDGEGVLRTWRPDKKSDGVYCDETTREALLDRFARSVAREQLSFKHLGDEQPEWLTYRLRILLPTDDQPAWLRESLTAALAPDPSADDEEDT
jgi:hypothetical protein